jgi:hypothetical protein
MGTGSGSSSGTTTYWATRSTDLGSMTPETAKLKNLDTQKEIPVRFNPSEITFEKGICVTTKPTPKGVPKLAYGGENPAKLTMKFLFDTTPTGADVRTAYTNFLLDLMKPKADQAKPQPPKCRFTWGSFSSGDMSFDAYVDNVSLQFTLFLPNGVPVRAETTVTFNQFPQAVQGTNPTSRSEARKTWIVTEGETLDWIAYKEYGRADAWRHIAKINDLPNPMELRSGMILKLTPLK